MIGEPTNFKHTAHIGSEDVNQTISCEPLRLSAIESQMKSKGGYESTLTIQVFLYIISTGPISLITPPPYNIPLVPILFYYIFIQTLIKISQIL
ncbi:hypothetical protein O3M35_004686 [Rhynocoris fuscipes]|uniref:CRIB domain-containing protein n=1 Tax=Rhynocoris fuscipes TaxID=488301 RepID=A0AAW1CFF5_9HEMI